MLRYVSLVMVANEGNFHEGLNFASILDLPVLLYVKITNLLKEQHDYASASETIAERLDL